MKFTCGAYSFQDYSFQALVSSISQESSNFLDGNNQYFHKLIIKKSNCAFSSTMLGVFSKKYDLIASKQQMFNNFVIKLFKHDNKIDKMIASPFEVKKFIECKT